MLLNSHFNQVLQYATFAVSNLREISTAFKNPVLSSAVSVTDAVLINLASTRSNKRKLITLLEHVHSTLCWIVQLHTLLEVDGVIPSGLAHEIASFTQTLQKIYSFLDTQQGVGRVKQLLRQLDCASQLKICEEELHSLLDRLQLLIGGGAVSSLAHVQRDAQQQHEELVGFLKSHELASSGGASSSTGTVSSMGSSSVSMSMLPPSPRIFYGRDSELEQLLNLFQVPSPRISILGPAGIGKSSLALSVLHHARVSEIFPNRYFVPCRSMRTGEDIVFNIASHVGLDMGPNLVQLVVRHLAGGPPALLILDNFETPWEPTSTRDEVEEILSLLSEVPQLAILITMRGAERPSRVKWTHPFFPPLSPLDESAALRTFVDIAGDDHVQNSIKELLALTGNLPLAVSLIANVAVCESCESILSRWQTEATRVLSDGYDQTSSLEISITFSVSSPRMTPEAQALLSILALLPEGLSPAELHHSNLPITSILEAKSTLIRTSLAYVSHRNRLLLLIPIREYIRAAYPPSPLLKATLRAYYRGVVDVSPPAPSADTMEEVFAALSNFHAIFEDGLTDPTANDVVQTLESAMRLAKFKYMARCKLSSPVPRVADCTTRFIAEPVYGTYLLNIFYSPCDQPMEILNEVVTRGTQCFEHAPELPKAHWYFALAKYHHTQGDLYCQNSFNSPYKTALLAPPEPTTEQLGILVAVARRLWKEGNHAAEESLSQKAQQSAAVLGKLCLKAEATAIEARCCIMTGDFVAATNLLHRARSLLKAGGLFDSELDARYQNNQAYMVLCRTDYCAARTAFTHLVQRYPARVCTPMNLLHIAVIDVITGAPGAAVRTSIDMVRQPFLARSEEVRSPLSLQLCDKVDALLLLREGDVEAARRIFQLLANSSSNHHLVIFSLERLSDLENGMNNHLNTLRWATVYLGHAVLMGSKLELMKSLRCLGQITGADQDTDTATALFEVALDGFTYMDVHWWRADCLTRKADILVARGEPEQARELFLAARALFSFCFTQNRVDYIDFQLRNIDTKL